MQHIIYGWKGLSKVQLLVHFLLNFIKVEKMLRKVLILTVDCKTTTYDVDVR